jgi:DNA-binding protein Fis
MKYTYINIDDDYFTTVNLKFTDSSSNATNLKLNDVPAPLYDMISQYHADNITDNHLYDRDSYSSYLRNCNIQNIFPEIFNFKYSLKPTQNYLDYMKDAYSVSLDESDFQKTYPIAVRYTNGTSVWLIERPPFQATITYRPAGSGYNSRHDTDPKTYNIWMPWTVMLINMDPKKSYYDASLYFNDGPINSLDDYAIPCFFPNMYGDGRMCLNQTSIMLQQHLADLNTFDINTVYNFLINDYMSGGWNLDLGVQNFDRIRQYGSTSKNVYEVITQGITGNKSYPTSITGRYRRVSPKKYIANLLNYFSLSSPNEILSIISETKETIQQLNSSNKYNHFRTYNEVIRDFSQNNKIALDTLSSDLFISSYLDHSFNVLANPDLKLYNISTENLNTLIETLINFCKIKFKDQIDNVSSTSDSFYRTSFEAENSFLYIENYNSVVEINNELLNDNQFFLNMMLSAEVLI